MPAKGQTAANKDGRPCGLAVTSGSGSLRPSVDRWTGDFALEGWITRDGKFLPCDREMGHPIVAMLALGGQDPETRAERMGWLRISDYGDRACKPLNQSQRNTLFDYCQALLSDWTTPRRKQRSNFCSPNISYQPTPGNGAAKQGEHPNEK